MDRHHQSAVASRRAVLLAGAGAILVAEGAHAAARSADRTPLMTWVRHLDALGRADRYGYRMPGTKSDHAAAHFIGDELRRLGLRDVTVEPIPIAVAFPDRWKLEVASGDRRTTVPCSFIRYAGYTPAEGLSADLVHVGRGEAADFDATDVRGKIVLVDIVPVPSVPRMGPRYATYDRNGTTEKDDANVAWPLLNMQSSYTEAVKRGAAGWIGSLEVFGDDTCEYHHWYAQYELPAVTISARSGRALAAALKPGDRATITLTGTRGQGVSYNVYGVVPGRRSDETIVVKSHHDGWATNEASGSSVTLGVAQRLMRPDAPRLERDVTFFFRASHFGVGWTINPSDRHLSVADATRIYGMTPGWENFSSRARDLLPKTIAANNIEMIGRQYRRGADGTWKRTDEPAVRHWGVTGPEGGANPVLLKAVKSAIRTHGLDRSEVSNFLLGDGWDYSEYGVPTVNFISHNVFQFTSKDTVETVMDADLDKAADAFVDIVRAEDAAGAAALRPAVHVKLKGLT